MDSGWIHGRIQSGYKGGGGELPIERICWWGGKMVEGEERRQGNVSKLSDSACVGLQRIQGGYRGGELPIDRICWWDGKVVVGGEKKAGNAKGLTCGLLVGSRELRRVRRY